MSERIIKIDLNKNVDEVLEKFKEEKIPILETLLNIGLNYYVPEDVKDNLIDDAMLDEKDIPYFPDSHREAIDLINLSISKLNTEVEKSKENENGRGRQRRSYR